MDLRTKIKMCQQVIKDLTDNLNKPDSYFICTDMYPFPFDNSKLDEFSKGTVQARKLVKDLKEFGLKNVDGFFMSTDAGAFLYKPSKDADDDECYSVVSNEYKRAKINHVTQYINHLIDKSKN